MSSDDHFQRLQQLRARLDQLDQRKAGRVEPGARAAALVRGRVVFDYGVPASALLVRLSGVDPGGELVPLGDATTDADGRYEVRAPDGASIERLEAVAVTRGGEVPLSPSRPAWQPTDADAFDLVAPRRLRPPEPEFARLCAALAPVLPQAVDLRFAADDGERQDLSAVATAAGWDGRLVALAAEAFAHAEETGAPAEGLYALYRCGLPLSPAALCQVRKAELAAALHNAVEAAIVGPEAVDATLEAIGAMAGQLRLSARASGTPSAIADFVAAAPLGERERARFRELVAGEEEDTPLWDRARAAGLSAETVAALQTQGRLAYLTFNNAPLGAHVQAQLRTNDLNELLDRDYDRAEAWSRALDAVAAKAAGGLESVVPGLFAGATPAERREAYAATLARRVRALDAQRATARAVGRGEIEGVPEALRAPVSRLLEAAMKRGFRLGRTPWSAFVDPQATAKAKVEPAVLEQAKSLHRLYGVSPDGESLATLYNAGLRSASDIARIPAGEFERAFGPKLGSVAAAREIHGRAGHAYAAALSVLGGAAALATTPTPAALGGGPGATKRRAERLVEQYPTLEVLFGGVDFCSCDSCRSVLSPTAYFVDLLRFLGPSPADWGRQKGIWQENHPGRSYDETFARPLDALLDAPGPNGLAPRRPDLQHIPLTCENTNTLLPYIDLVNELLEVQVDGGDLAAETFDTGEASSEALLAEPQHVRWPAYDALKAAVYPIGLPFDLPLEMVRALLERLGVPLWRLRELFAAPERLEGEGPAPGMLDAWFERLGVGPGDARLLTGGVPWHEAYGYPSAEAALAEGGLRNAQVLARRLGVSYVELVELIKTRFVNPELERMGVLRKLGLDPHVVARFLGTEQPPLDESEASALAARLLQVRDRYPGFDPQSLAQAWSPAAREKIVLLRMPASGCDFSAATVALAKAPANEPAAIGLALWRLNLFVRLRRALGWSIADLDVLLGAFVRPGVGGLSAAALGPAMCDALAYLAHVVRIEELAAGPVRRAELAALWGPVPDALYEELFLAPGAFERDPAFDDALGHYLQNEGVPFGPHAPAVAAALRLRAEDIDAIFAHAGVVAPALTMTNVSLLFRHAVLARLAGCDVPSLLALLSLSAAEPLRPLADAPLTSPADASPFAQTIPFLEAARRVAESGRGVAWLAGLARAGGAIDGAAAGERVDRLLAAIREGSAPAGEPDPVRDLWPVVQAVCAQLSASESLITALLTDPNVLAEADGGGPLIDALLAGRAVGLTATGDDLEAFVRLPAHGTYAFELAPPRAATLTIDGGDESPFGTEANPRASVAGLEAGRLYRIRVRSAGDATLIVSAPGLEPVPIGALLPLPEGAHRRFAAAATRLVQAVALLDALAMTERDLRENASALANPLRLNDLPAGGGSPPARGLFEGVLGWWGLLDVARELRISVEDAANVARAARLKVPAPGPAAEEALRAQLGAALGRALGRDAASVGEALEALGLRPVLRGQGAPVLYEVPGLTTPEGLRRVAEALRAVDACGAGAAQVAAWAAPELDAATAARARSALKAHYAGDAWRAVARPVFDRLRPKQRDALVALLLHRDDTPYRTPEELYAFLLLDPGTEPPVLTTRIQLAIASAQLFVQRCLMGLEARVPPGIIDGKRWAWMRRYRVWEANRKIFLWPENWLEPELRDDKTHLFRQLEGAILQGDASEAVVEAGLRTYLRELESIARLEMVTTYYEAGVSADSWTLHVVGRTPHRPHKYFYRRGSHGMWTPWEPVGVEIEGDHLALALWYDRLHLFWVSFFEQSATREPSAESFAAIGNTKGPAAMKPDQTIGVQLNWVERFEGAWVNRSATPLTDAPKFKNFFAAGQLARDALFIHVVNPPPLEGSPADALEVHVSHASGTSLKFRLDGKLAPPRLLDGQAPPPVAHLSASAPRVTKREGAGSLAVKFRSKVRIEDANETFTEDTHTVLKKAGTFRVLLPTNPVPRNAGGEDRSVVQGRPCSYEPAGEAGPVQYVAYRGSDGHLHLIFGEGRVGPTASDSLWYHTDVTAAVQGEPLKSDPSGYAWLAPPHPTNHAIAYVGTNGRLYEAYEDAAGWHVDDLTDASPNASPPAGRPLGGVFWLHRSVAYRDTDGHVFVVHRPPGAAQPWRRVRVTTDLTPRAASNLASAWGPATQQTLFLYRDTSNHIVVVSLRGHSYTPHTEGHVDVNAVAPSAPPASEGDLAALFVYGRGLFVAYRAADGRVHLLFSRPRLVGSIPSPALTRDVGPPWPFAPSDWVHEPIGAGKPAAVGSPCAWLYGTRIQIAYLGEDGHVHMFYRQMTGATTWHYVDVTLASGQASTDAAGDLSGHAFRRYNDDHIVYRTPAGKLGDLQYALVNGARTWVPSEVGLAQTYLDDAGALTAPFFFEDDAYTFFVQPSLTVKSAHEWPGYVPIPSPSPSPALVEPRPVTAHFPGAVPAHSRAEGDWLAGGPLVLQTGRGAFGPDGAEAAAFARTMLPRSMAPRGEQGAAPAGPATTKPEGSR